VRGALFDFSSGHGTERSRNLHLKVLDQERPLIGRLFDNLAGRFASAVSRSAMRSRAAVVAIIKVVVTLVLAPIGLLAVTPNANPVLARSSFRRGHLRNFPAQ
jgi:hypothetical protein